MIYLNRMADRFGPMPLFPLGTVLYPYASLYLHIFEPRYRTMVEVCRENDEPFGVVLLREGEEVGMDQEPYMVGTAARIKDVFTYPDGRMDIHVQGEHRFRIRAIDRDAAPFLVGRVEGLEEEPWPDYGEADALLELARDRFEALVQAALAGRQFNVRVEFPDDPVALSFAMANLIELEVRKKQLLLETTDTVDRLAEIVPALEDQLAALREQAGAVPVVQPLTPEDVAEWVTPN